MSPAPDLQASLPRWVAEPLRGYQTLRGDEVTRVQSGNGAVERILAHAVSAMAGLLPSDVELPKPVRSLLKKSPSMGDWCKAVLGTAEAIQSLGDRPDPIRRMVEGLLAEGPSIAGKEREPFHGTRAYATMYGILSVRNDAAHQRSTLTGQEVRDYRRHVDDLLRMLTPLAELGVGFVDKRRRLENGDWETVIVRLHGSGESVVRLYGTDLPMPDDVPLFLSTDGVIWRADPWIRVGRFPGSTHRSAGLLTGPEENGRGRYTAATGLDETLPVAQPSRQRWRVDQSVADRLLGTNLDGAPSLRNLSIEVELGRGGAGVVYSARSRRPGPPARLAVKVLHPQVAERPSAVRRFEREAEALNRLEIDGVVRFYGLENDERGRPCLLMEHVEGRSLRDQLEEVRQWDREALFTFADALLEVIAALHRSQVIHRDIKPSNVFIEPGGTPRLLDFGIAALDDDRGITRTLDNLGTPSWSAPEQLNGRVRPDARADLYAIGRMLQLLFDGRTNESAAHAVARWATADDPDRRPPSAEMVRDALRLARREPGTPVVVGEWFHDKRIDGQVQCHGGVWSARWSQPDLGGSGIAVIGLGPVGADIAETIRSTKRDRQQLRALNLNTLDGGPPSSIIAMIDHHDLNEVLLQLATPDLAPSSPATPPTKSAPTNERSRTDSTQPPPSEPPPENEDASSDTTEDAKGAAELVGEWAPLAGLGVGAALVGGVALLAGAGTVAANVRRRQEQDRAPGPSPSPQPPPPKAEDSPSTTALAERRADAAARMILAEPAFQRWHLQPVRHNPRLRLVVDPTGHRKVLVWGTKLPLKPLARSILYATKLSKHLKDLGAMAAVVVEPSRTSFLHYHNGRLRPRKDLAFVFDR